MDQAVGGPGGHLVLRTTIEWVPATERATFAAQLRRMEGKDYDLRGDALLFTITQDRHAVVIERS